MAKNSAIRIALDLETTGLHADQDAILEVAAIKFQDHTVLDTFETFVSPGRSIPFRVQRLTGIKAELLAGAPLFETISKKLQQFLGDYPIVGHSIPFDVGFLRRWGLARSNALVDTFELATVMLPSLSSYNLGQVAESLGIEVPQDRHRAMVDTVLAMDVFLALHERLQQVELSLLKDLANLDAPRSWPLLHFFRQELRDRQERDGLQGSLVRGSLGDRFAAQLGMDPRVLSFAISQKESAEPVQKIPPVASPTSLQVKIEQDAVLVSTMASAADQRSTVTSNFQTARTDIYHSLDQLSSLLVEVTVDGNEYTPALLPVLEWIEQHSHSSPEASSEAPPRLVIACVNQQNARRLIETTLPRLQSTLHSQLSVAYQAEHGGYLCTHRWFGAALRRTSGELTAEQARGLAKLGLWAQQTLTGERSELTLLPQEISAWERISSGIERLPPAESRAGTVYQRCTYRRKGFCFVERAEERVNAAQIVVTTHAGLFDDLSRTHSLLAGIKRRLILDADLLEEEYGRWSNVELQQAHLLALLNTVGTELSDGRYQGLLALAAPSLRENGPGGLSNRPTIAKAELDARMLTWFQALRQARGAVETLFSSFHAVLDEIAQQSGREKGRGERAHGGRGGAERTEQPVRLNSQIQQVGSWTQTARAWQQAAHRLQVVIDLLHEAEKLLLSTQRNRRRQEIGSGEESSMAAEFSALAQQLLEQKKLGQEALLLSEGNTVYWLRMPPPPPANHTNSNARSNDAHPPQEPVVESVPVLYAQSIQASSFLRRFLHTEKTSTIFAGSALSVDDSFAFARGRFALENEASVSVVADHHEQTLLYLPDDVPEPNIPQYQRHLDETLIQLALALDGQLVTLFTSHAALRSSYAAIKSLLETRGILVLGQGMDGSPRQLWQIFQKQERVVLLGTGSFWEGAEDVTHSPTCTVIARLPMPVLNDPPIAARADLYSDQLHQLTVPMAALRMKRAFNRLVWNDQKRNVIVIFDKRVISKEYGSMILHSLPRTSQRQGPASHMSETILDWLTAAATGE